MVIFKVLVNRIWKKLAIAFLTVTFLPIVYFIHKNLVDERALVADRAANTVLLNAFVRSRDIEATLKDVYQDINYLRSSLAIEFLVNQPGGKSAVLPYWRSLVEKEFELFLSQKNAYAGAGFLDEYGDEKVIFYRSQGRLASLPDEQKHNRLTSKYYVVAAKEHDYGVAAIPMRTSIDSQENLFNQPLIRYATKVFDRSGRPRGVVYLDLNPSKFYVKLNQTTFDQRRKAAMVTNTGGYINDPFASLQSWSNPSLPAKNISQEFSDHVVAQILSGRNGVITDDADNIFAFRAIYPRPTDNEFFYVVFDRYPRADLMGEINKLKEEYLRWLLGALALCVAVATVVSYGLTRNIGKLRDGVEMIRRKVLGHRLNIRSGDEIEALAHAYNTMAESLQEYSGSLEKKVEERSQHIKQVERKLMQAEKLAAIGFLAAGVAHEVNNPISILITRLELIKKELEKGRSDMLKKDVDVLLAHSIRIGRIAGNLLSFSRGASTEVTDASLNEVVERVMSLLEIQLRRKGVALDLSLERDLPAVSINVPGMEQVIYNIVYNAYQATDAGGAISVATRLDEGGKVELKIGDTGCGMDEKVLEHIFEPFFTTKEVGSGTGLGLAISYGIISQIGALMNVKSAPGEGTVFTIQLVPAKGAAIFKVREPAGGGFQ